MKDFVFTSVAFGSAYITQQDRLRASILAIYPDANIMFWRDELPYMAKPMPASLYGFKVHAIAEARKYYKRVLWLDPAMIVVKPVDILFPFSIVAVKDDNKLHNWVAEKFLKKVMIPKKRVEESGWHLVGGSLYYFDFRSASAGKVFDTWYQYEMDGDFGTQVQAAREEINSHRNDESCMAIALYMNGCEPTDADKVGYCIAEGATFSKLHFK